MRNKNQCELGNNLIMWLFNWNRTIDKEII